MADDIEERSPGCFIRREFNMAVLAGACVVGKAGIGGARPELVLHMATAGARHHALPRLLPTFEPATLLQARAVFDNPFDDNAVAIHHADGSRLSYMSRADNLLIAQWLRPRGSDRDACRRPARIRARPRHAVRLRIHQFPERQSAHPAVRQWPAICPNFRHSLN